jgi:Ca2+-binding RTX toxin-like protein
MLIQYTQGGNFIEAAFYNPLIDDFDISVLSASSTQIVAVNPGTGVVTTFTGTGFPALPIPPLSGTLTGFSMADAQGNPLATVSGISWGLQATLTALEAAVGNDALTLLNGLFSLQDITLDASAAVEGIYGLDFAGVTSDVTVIGSDFVDDIFGGQGNDTIDPGSAPGLDDNPDVIHGSTGNDTLDYSGLTPGNAYSVLTYDGLTGPITVNINAQTNTGSVAKGPGQGTDTLVDVANVLDGSRSALDVHGTTGADSFTLQTAATSSVWLIGGRGSDTFSVALVQGCNVTMGFFGFNEGPTQGIVIDASTGVIANDGFGFAETLTLTRAGDVNGSVFSIVGTNFADNIIGSDGRDRLRGNGGNDTLDGGAGFDQLQYNRSQATSGVTVNLAAHSATGVWSGVAFTHALSNIEEVIGTRFADSITGDVQANRFDGGAGNDTLTGGAGRDTVLGGDGDDTIIVHSRFYDDIDGGETGETTGDRADFSASGGNFAVDLATGTYVIGGLTYALTGIETLVTGNGRDIVTGSDGAETILSGGKRDQITGGLGDDTIDAGGGNDVVFAGLGNDSTNGGADVDTLDFSALAFSVIYSMVTGASNVIGTHINYESIICGGGNDQITGGDTNDTIRGNAGNDVINGGRGADSLLGLSGSDTLSGEGGNDTLTGGAFADTFMFVRVLGAGSDLVTDFGNGADRLALDDALWNGVLTTAQVVSSFASVVGGDVVFDFGSRGSFTLDGVASTAGLDTRIDIF